MNKRLFASQYNRLEILCNGNIPKRILDRIEYFRQLDIEYLDNIKNNIIKTKIFLPKYFKNLNWRGVIQRATGDDEFIYICNIVYYLQKLSEGTRINLVNEWKEGHPDEKYIPFSISIIEIDCINKYVGVKYE